MGAQTSFNAFVRGLADFLRAYLHPVDLVTGEQYVGQAMSDERYMARQIEHAMKYPNAQFEFYEVGRAPAGIELDKLEEGWIRAGGGPKTARNPEGTLVNKRFQMNDMRYRAAGGDVCR